MPNEGYIKLYRSIMDNKLWYTRPFAKGQAWVELLMMANHEDNDIMFGNQSIHIERGSFITSILKLSERWGWSRHRVKDFINFLISLQMVDLKTDNQKSLITIVNYTLYQGSENKKDIAKDNKRTTKGQQKDTNKNDKNDKNDKKGIEDIEESPQKSSYGEFQNVLLTIEEYEKLLNLLGTQTQSYIDRLDGYIASKGAKYKSHYATILNWYRKDEKDKPQSKSGNPFLDMLKEEQHGD